MSPISTTISTTFSSSSPNSTPSIPPCPDPRHLSFNSRRSLCPPELAQATMWRKAKMAVSVVNTFKRSSKYKSEGDPTMDTEAMLAVRRGLQQSGALRPSRAN